MTPQQKKNTKKLVNFLENVVHPTKFDLRFWVKGDDPKGMAARASEANSCKTSACVIGWFPHLFPTKLRWVRCITDEFFLAAPGETHGEANEGVVFSEVTGLSPDRIICPANTKSGTLDEYGRKNYMRPTPKRVAAEIRALAKEEHGFEW